MQIIQNIRDKGAAIVIGVIALSLIGFLLMDAKGSGNRLFGGSGNDETIGKVNGESLGRKEYDEIYAQLELQGSTGANARMNAWEQMVAIHLLTDEAEKLGISFSANELTTLLYSEDAPQQLKQQFTDPQNGTYNVDAVKEWWKRQKKLRDNVPAEKKEKDETYAKIIDPLKLQTIYTKYNSLFAAATFYPTWMKKKDSADATSFANVTYAAVPYDVISDSTVTVTDKELKDYADKHKKQYAAEEDGRMISYYSYSSAPNAKDTLVARTSAEETKVALAKDSIEKMFVLRNSALPNNYSDDHVYKSKMQGQYKDTLGKLAKGEVFGPYQEGKYFMLAKMVDVKQQPDSVFCRHILIKLADLNEDGSLKAEIRADSTAKKLVDSIALAIKNGADFNEMVLKYSDDGGSKANKGEYHFNYTMGLVDSFYRTVFYEPVGTKKVVLGYDQRSYVGYHYIEVLNQFNFEPAYKIAYVAKEIVSSEETVNSASQNAVKLAGGYHTAKALDEYAAKNGIPKIVASRISKEGDYSVGQIAEARKVIQWAFKAKEGEVSDPIVVGDLNIVAVLDKIINKGDVDMAASKKQLENKIREEKKTAEILKKLGAAPTVETAAAAYPNLTVQTAGADSAFTFSTLQVTGIGPEGKVIGAAFNKDNLNKNSKPIVGITGVYVIRVNSVTPMAAADYEKRKEAIQRQRSGSLEGMYRGWYPAIRKQASVKDYRIKNGY